MKGASENGRDALKPETVLEKYVLDRVLGHGGFGIVHLAHHQELGTSVAIKEYMPTDLAVRQGNEVRLRNDDAAKDYSEGLRRFRDEARRLSEFQQLSSIVSCRDFFST